MTSIPAADGATAEQPLRPKTVDYAVLSIAIRCVLGVITSVVAWSARGYVTDQLRKNNPKWTASKLHSQVNSSLWSGLIESIVIAVILGLLVLFIRRGKPWSRWVFALLAFLFFGDLFRITAIFTTGAPFGYRALNSLTALCTWVAIGFLFTPWSSRFFRGGREAAVRPSLFGSMFRPRGAAGGPAGATRPGAPRPAANRSTPARTVDVEPAPSGTGVGSSSAKRSTPRGKSRKGGRR